jgi:transposase InsO family protein
LSQYRNKSALAKAMGISRATLYYRHTLPDKDWALKTRIEAVLRDHPSYGSRRLSQTLAVSRPRIQRVMRLFGLKPYRRHTQRWRKPRKITVLPNLLLTTTPSYPHHIWAADFTELAWEKKVYVATVLDLYTRRIVGLQVGIRKGTPLTMQALTNAVFHHPRPQIFHSDNGREYEAKSFVEVLTRLGIQISRSKPGCPWENGYQESFYGKFKLDLGDAKRYKTLGELVAAIYATVWAYNHTRIHSALQMPPVVFALKQKTAVLAV